MDDQIKELLIQFHNLPKYQLERRLDIFILSELESVLSTILGEDISFLYPEFPLHNLITKKTLNLEDITAEYCNSLKVVDTNHNTNADYLFVSDNCFYLVELKTNGASFNDYKQVLYYAYYSGKNFSDLYSFFKNNLALGKAQNSKWKNGCYFLINKLESIYSTNNFKEYLDKEIKIIYIVPEKVKTKKLYDKIYQLGPPFDFRFITLGEISNNLSDSNLQKILKEIN